MSVSILICDPDINWANELKVHLEKYSYDVHLVDNGKIAQSKLYKMKYSAIVLDFKTQNNSSLSVLKYIKLNSPSLRVIYTLESLEVMEAELGLTKSDLKHLGVYDVVEKPTTVEEVLKLIELYSNPTLWSKVESTDKVQDEVEISEPDDSFDKIPSKTFFSGNKTIYDIYVRLGANKYIKVLHKGDNFEKDRLNSYLDEKKVEFFYFKIEDRLIYINVMNKLLSKLENNPKASLGLKAKIAENLADKYISEVHTKGMNPRLVEEGKDVCDNIYKLFNEQSNFRELLGDFSNKISNSENHGFIVSFFAIAIGKKLDWITPRSVEHLGMGAMIHDIGKMKLPEAYRNKKLLELENPEEIAEYKKHPLYGYEILEEYPFMTTPVRQIVLHHHECLDGSGFPLALTGMKIFPMAKIVALANAFVGHVARSGKPPVEALSSFVRNPEYLTHYDNVMLRALMENFIVARGRKAS